MSDHAMNAIDFFCGAGGLTRGLLNAGIAVTVGLDANEGCRKTYEENNKPAKFLCADIRHLKGKELKAKLGSCAREEFLMAGCAPCQPFSQIRRGGRTKDGTLLWHFARLVSELKPGQILIENVPGLKRVKGFSTYLRFFKLLEEMDYAVAEDV